MKGRVAAGATPPLVLISNPTRLSDFDAPTKRDNSPFANRIAAVGFDFSGSEVALAGTFGSQLDGTFVLPRDLPTNPFRHKYHPDHDDLDARFQAPAADLPPDQQEVWGLTRALQLTFLAPPTPAPATPSAKAPTGKRSAAWARPTWRPTPWASTGPIRVCTRTPSSSPARSPCAG